MNVIYSECSTMYNIGFIAYHPVSVFLLLTFIKNIKFLAKSFFFFKYWNLSNSVNPEYVAILKITYNSVIFFQ